MITLTIDLFFITLAFALAVVMPILAVWDFHRLKKQVAEGRTDARMSAYRWTMIIQWGLVAAFVAWWLGMGRDLGQASMDFGPAGWQWLAIGAGILLVALQIGQAISVLRDPEKQAELQGKIGSLDVIVPRTSSEVNAFGFLSVTAGICEEILYRGLLMGALSAVIGLWPAVAVSSVIFGLGHAYQGGAGVLKTGAVGLAMALLTVFSGSIWVAALVHIVIDATSGRMMTAALAQPAPTPEPEPAG